MSKSIRSSLSHKVPTLLISVVCLILTVWPAQAQTPTINTFAGNGSAAFSGDGGSAGFAALNHPRGLAVSSTGQIYIADMDNFRIRTVSPSGMILTFAGNGLFGSTGDGGPAANASFSDVTGLALDAAGNLYVADAGNRKIRKISASGVVSTIAGTGVQGSAGDGGPAINATLNRPTSVAVDAAGNVYFSDSSNQRIRKISTNGTITTVAGNGTDGFSGDGGLAVNAAISFPLGLAVDGAGNIYFADANNNRVRKVSPTGIITTFAGNGQARFAGDGGTAFNASLNIPWDVTVDAGGNVYIADAGNNRVRKVDSSGTISTFAGTGIDGFSGDGGPAAQAALNFPWGLATDPSGAVYIADRANNRVRKIGGGAIIVQPPTLQSDSPVVNGASFTKNIAVAPGGIVTIFGSGFATAATVASGAPYPRTLGETTVTFNGFSAPLFYVSPGQINAQLPFEVFPGIATVQVKRGTMTSTLGTVSVANVSPGIFIMDQTTSQGAILRANFSLVGPTNPVRSGETVLIYATGLGQLQGFARTGDPSPVVNTTTLPVVRIGGLIANVSYSGTAPGFAGLYQVNVAIPSGLAPGNQQVQISMNGVLSNVATIAIAQ